MNTITLDVEARTDLGKKATHKLRKEGKVPCVMYGSGNEPHHFVASELAISKVVYTPNFYVVDVNLEGQQHKAILKDLQFHPVTDKVIHLDFQALDDSRKVLVDIPLVFEGLAEGVRAGGKLMAKMRTLKVKAFPKDLIPELKVDVTELVLGKSIKVGAVSYDNIEIMNNPNTPICSVEIPRALKSAAAAEEEGAEGEAAEGAEGEAAAE